MGADVNSLAEPLRSATINLIADAKAHGKTVVVISARRTGQEQIDLRKANCATVKGQPSEADIYTKPSGQCSPETAIPGTSKHERGEAVDLGGDLDYVAANASKFGLVRTVASEKWHYEHSTTAHTGDSSPDSAPSKGGGLSITDVPGIVGGLGDAVATKVVPGYGAIKSTAEAAVAVAQAILNPTTWVRAVGILAGLGLTVVGLNMISKDIGGPSVSPGGIATKATAAAAADPAAVAAIA